MTPQLDEGWRRIEVAYGTEDDHRWDTITTWVRDDVSPLLENAALAAARRVLEDGNVAAAFMLVHFIDPQVYDKKGGA